MYYTFYMCNGEIGLNKSDLWEFYTLLHIGAKRVDLLVEVSGTAFFLEQTLQ